MQGRKRSDRHWYGPKLRLVDARRLGSGLCSEPSNKVRFWTSSNGYMPSALCADGVWRCRGMGARHLLLGMMF
jgi:hypothetical protein